MKISASIFSSGHRSTEDLILELDKFGVDLLHLDWSSNNSIEQILNSINQISATPIDIHLIVPDPFPIFNDLKIYNVDYCCLQFENLNPNHKETAFLELNKVTKNSGVAITLNTPSENLKQIIDYVSYIMLMTTTPGVSGGKFTPNCFQKIIELKNLYPDKKIHVDGGVTEEVSYILKLLGVDVLISGSYLTSQENILKGILGLHKPLIPFDTQFKISQFMIPLRYLPCIPANSNTIFIIKTIEKYGLGFALIIDKVGKLEGIVSNADIRRNYLKSLEEQNLNETSILINTNPFTIDESNSAYELHDFINNLNRIILFLPVINSNGILKGAILLNNLTKA